MTDKDHPAQPARKWLPIFTIISTIVPALLIIVTLTHMHQITIDPPCGGKGISLACGYEDAKTPRIATQDYYMFSSAVIGYTVITVFLCIASLRDLSKNPSARSKKSVAAIILGLPGYLGFSIIVFYVGLMVLSLIL